MIQIYCTVKNSTTVTFTWTHNGGPLLNDPPHIRIREDNRPQRSASLLTNDSMTVLTVDNFIASDNGVYQCTASGATIGTAITLTGIAKSTQRRVQIATPMRTVTTLCTNGVIIIYYVCYQNFPPTQHDDCG